MMIRKIYKNDYRGYESTPARGVLSEELKYSRKNDRPRLRELLAVDFHNRCGYCGWTSINYDVSTFHIDHLLCKDKYPHLEDSYENYVYSCPICNTTKGDVDIAELGIDIDPTKELLKKCLYRNKYGAIVVNNDAPSEMKQKAYWIIEKIGLYKDLHKIDYVADALDKILRRETTKEISERDLLLITQIVELNQFLKDTYIRRTENER